MTTKISTSEKEILKALENIRKEEAQNRESQKKVLAVIAEKLFLDMVNTVEAHYNGEGDNGDIEDLVFKDVNEQEMKYKINEKIKNELIDALFYFLPGGWEIDDGSYGVVYFDVRKRALTVAHEQRIIDTDHQEYKYDL